MTPKFGFRVLDAAIPSDNADWEALWEESPRREPSAHPAYIRLFQGVGERALAATYISNDSCRILYPFLLRRIDSPLSGGPYFDISSPYGYGGPLFWPRGSETETYAHFWSAFGRWAESNHIVSEFIRFDLFEGADAHYPGEAVLRQPSVVVSLGRRSSDELWRSFEPKVRKNVKRARENGVIVSIDDTGAQLKDFMAIYEGTMNRRAAAERYNFPRTFFERIHREMRGQFAYFHAHREGQSLSAELVLISADTVYSFLGGTDANAFNHRPNDLIKFEIASWAQSAGKEYFVLGGGLTAGDGIERFKRAFAPNGLTGFRTGQRVLMPAIYQALTAVSTSGQNRPPAHFPAYRW